MINPHITTLILVPAYGRDYKNENDLLKDWDKDLDFAIVNTDYKGGKYINKSDFYRYRNEVTPNLKYIKFRYNKIRKVKVIKPEEKPTFNRD
jgi:hypothetical protein